MSGTILDLDFPLIEEQGERRTWMLSVIMMTVSSICAAFASLILHYTQKGSDEYGCSSETLGK